MQNLSPVPESLRIETPPDPRDLPGQFRHRVDIDVRFADTDAMGHVNNAVYLTYCEAARIGYWEVVTGEPLAGRHHDAESLILAEARITYRAQVFATDRIVVETRAGRIGTSSFTLEHRLTAHDAVGAARLVAVSDFDPRALRLRRRPGDPARRRLHRLGRVVRGPLLAPAAMTFSIVARDAETGDLGIAVASKFLAVGSVVPWARAGVGAIATQAYANVRFGPDGLNLMADGVSAEEALRRLTDADPGAAERQAGFVDAIGRAATFTGAGCLHWAGGRTAEGVAAQGNILTGPEVVDAILAAYAAADGPFAGRLLDALLAGDRAGGDARGRQSAAILIVREDGGYAGGNDRWIDLRVDDHEDPVPELIRTWGVWRLLMERPDPADLLEIDAALAAELRERLTALGWAPEFTPRRRPGRRRSCGTRHAAADRRPAAAHAGLGCGMGRRAAHVDGPRQPRGTDRGVRPDRSGGADGPARGVVATRRQSTTRRKMLTAFWPPNPKPSTATVSTFAGRATSGT